MTGAAADPGVSPRATYRLQLRADFTFDDAAALVPYLRDLGVSHLYLSPVTAAVPGSTHGYDVADPSRLSDDLGGEAGFARLREAARSHGLGLLVDVVPNHLSTDPDADATWRDLLEDGRLSPSAAFFDVDWDAPAVRGRVLLPVLGADAGVEAAAGTLRVAVRDGLPVVAYHDHTFPIAWATTAAILDAAASRGAGDLRDLAHRARTLPSAGVDPDAAPQRAHRREARDRLRTDLRTALRVDNRREAVAAAVDILAGSPDGLARLLGSQPYVLASWRTGANGVNYRRFFTIGSLAGVRVEDPAVFDATHTLVTRLVERGDVDGLRIDHVDGLRDPAAYLKRLRDRGARWVVVEKILDEGEALPDGWAVDGTTGYEFGAAVAALLADPAGAEPLSRLYEEVTGDGQTFDDVLEVCKRRVLDGDLGADVARAARLVGAATGVDVDAGTARRLVVEVLCAMPVYRTYARDGTAGEPDRAVVATVVQRVRSRMPADDGVLVDRAGEVMLATHNHPAAAELRARLQQTAPAVMAKGLEDTALYRYNRLVALNEVGLRPTRFGMSVEAFHAEQAAAQRRHPRTLLATSTHDSKRGEDVRVRLLALTGAVEPWGDAVRRWSAAVSRYTRGGPVGGDAVYLLLQAMVGAHPLGATRAAAYMRKAAREAAVHTSWTEPDAAYESALLRLVEGTCADRALLADIDCFTVALDRRARTLAAAQTLLRATCPGVPDTYQGAEAWEPTLVDPDNRRAVAYDIRRRLLHRAATATPAEVAGADLGLLKMTVLHRALALRARRPQCFDERGDYMPLVVDGSRAGDVVAFARGSQPGAVTVVCRRARPGVPWDDTAVVLPRGRWRDVFGGGPVEGGRCGVAGLLATLPVALLERPGR